MTTSYPLCVRLDSRDQVGLPARHPFYYLVHDTLQDIIKCPLILHYIAKNTFPRPSDEVAEEQRVREIIQYLQNNCPEVSGSDSPAMDSSLVQTRAYSGCHGGRDPKSKKVARQHVYLQTCLIDAWLNIYSTWTEPERIGHYLFFTFFMRLCLLRGFITAVELAFGSENVNVKDQAQSSPGSVHGTPCSFERFLWEWNCWVTFWVNRPLHKTRPKYDETLSYIVFSDRDSFCHIHMTNDINTKSNLLALLQFTAGDWTAFPPVKELNFQVIHPNCMRMWDSPPTEGQDHKPGRIETTAWSNMDQEGTVNEFDLSSYSPRRWITIRR